MQKTPIENLLELYLHRQLSREQEQELCDRLNQACDEDQADASQWMAHLWERTEMEGPDISSKEAVSKLMTALSIKDKDPRFFLQSPHSAPAAYSGIRIFLRYAAVFLLAFGLAWLVFKPEKTGIIPRSSQVNVFTVPNGSRGFLTLVDGTRIWLNCGSRLSYADFAGAETREVFLEGEAFFDVTRDRKKPFVVNTSDLQLRVLGTRFNVKSYPSEKITETILVSGKVQIEERNSTSTGKRIITLKPNQKATFYSSTKKHEPGEKSRRTETALKMPAGTEIIETVNPVMYTSWKDEKLIFSNERLENLVIKMERWYNVKITIKDTLLSNFRYTGEFEKESIEQALQALKLATPLEYRIDKNNIALYLSGKNK